MAVCGKPSNVAILAVLSVADIAKLKKLVLTAFPSKGETITLVSVTPGVRGRGLEVPPGAYEIFVMIGEGLRRCVPMW